jgi:hypothetical protein
MRGGTHIYACICVFVDRRWKKQEISGFTSLFELGIQFAYNLLRGAFFDRLCSGHIPLSKSTPGITIEAEWK